MMATLLNFISFPLALTAFIIAVVALNKNNKK